MANSGRFTKTFANGKCVIGINWEITGRSSVTYETDIKWTADITNNSSNKITIKKGNISYKPFDSDSYSTLNSSMSRTFPAGATTPIYRNGLTETTEYTDTVKHDVYGKATASIEIECTIDAYIDGVYCSSVSVGGTLELEPYNKIIDIELDKDSAAFGEKVKISVPYMPTCTFVIEAHMGNVVEEIARNTTTIFGRTVNWTVNESLADAIPASTVGFCTVVCDTYDTNTMTLIGSRTYPLTLYVPDSAVPTVKAEIEAERTTLDYQTSSGETAYENFYLAGFTRINVTSDCTGKLGSSIKSILVTVCGHTYSGSDVTTEIIPRTASGNIPITIKATDSRGFSTTISKQVNITAYNIPKIENFAIHRCLEDGTLDDEGNNCLVELKASVKSLLSGKIECNEISALLEVKRQSTGETEEYYFDCSGGISYDGSLLIPGLDEDACYDITVSVSDKVTNVDDTAYLSTADTILDIYNDGTGIAIGKVAEYPDLFEVDMPTKFNRKVEIKEFPHASPDDTAYGKGNENNYGHVKLSDSVESTSGASEGTAATPAAVKAVTNGSFMPRGQLTSADDLEDLSLSPGSYFCKSADSPENLPNEISVANCLIDIEKVTPVSDSERRIVKVYPYNSDGREFYQKIYAYGANGTWHPWIKFIGNTADEMAWKPLPLASGVTTGLYSREVPVYRKIGNQVFIEGSVAFTTTDSTQTIATLPTGYRPAGQLRYFIVPLTGYRIARLSVRRSNGAVEFGWAFNINVGERVTAEITWLDISCSFFVD